jgi:aspartate/methionine/tyrosine aminotransferase
MSIVNEGDEVICPNPAYPAYESVLKFVKANIKYLPLREENNFSFDLDELKSLITNKTKLVIINNPQNPTGGIIPLDDLKELANLSEKYGFIVLSDEIYDRIVYDEKFISYLNIKQSDTIIINGFSKTYAMTGWRLGWAIIPDYLISNFQKLAINLYSCTPTFSQYAAIEALEGPQDSVTNMVNEFKKRRDYVYDRINNIEKLSMIKPKGAFYAFINIKKTNLESTEFFNRLLNEYNVAVLSGTAFGKYGEGYIRVSYATSLNNLKEGIDKIEKFVKSL